MADGVAVVEEDPVVTRITLVTRHYLSLQGDASCNDIQQRLSFKSNKIINVVLQFIENSRSSNLFAQKRSLQHGVLHNLGPFRPQLIRRLVLQHGSVHADKARMKERPDQIASAGMVQGGFAA